MRQRQQRVFRERKDIFREYTDAELIQRYRLDGESILLALTDLVKDVLQSETSRNPALTLELKVAVTLRYSATGNTLLLNGSDSSVSADHQPCYLADPGSFGGASHSHLRQVSSDASGSPEEAAGGFYGHGWISGSCGCLRRDPH